MHYIPPHLLRPQALADALVLQLQQATPPRRRRQRRRQLHLPGAAGSGRLGPGDIRAWQPRRAELSHKEPTALGAYSRAVGATLLPAAK